MDLKGSHNPSTVNLNNIPLIEEGVVYVAIKGSLHASDCSVFGLGDEEIRALTKKFPGSGVVVNGVTMKTNVLHAINSLAQLGYKIVSSTAFNGEKDKVNMLIDRAKNAKEFVNIPDNSGYTALHYAARNGHIDICRTLLQIGAHVDALTSGLATPLHKAAAAGEINTVKYLLQSGACITKQDVDGQTALHKAIANKRKDLVNVLLEACPQLASVKDNKGRVAAELS